MKAKENPFRVERVHALRFRPVGWDWNFLQTRLRQLSCRAAIVGPEGSGKTTLLDELAARLSAQSFDVSRITLRAETRQVPHDWQMNLGHSGNRILLLDGAEQMSPSAWRRFIHESRNLHGLVITTHRPGLLPTLVECSTHGVLLNELLAELLPAETLQSLGGLPDDLLAKHAGNIRLVLRDLYDHFAVM